jgi:hypothetical protein
MKKYRCSDPCVQCRRTWQPPHRVRGSGRWLACGGSIDGVGWMRTLPVARQHSTRMDPTSVSPPPPPPPLLLWTGSWGAPRGYTLQLDPALSFPARGARELSHSASCVKKVPRLTQLKPGHWTLHLTSAYMLSGRAHSIIHSRGSIL